MNASLDFLYTDLNARKCIRSIAALYIACANNETQSTFVLNIDCISYTVECQISTALVCLCVGEMLFRISTHILQLNYMDNRHPRYYPFCEILQTNRSPKLYSNVDRNLYTKNDRGMIIPDLHGREAMFWNAVGVYIYRALCYNNPIITPLLLHDAIHQFFEGPCVFHQTTFHKVNMNARLTLDSGWMFNEPIYKIAYEAKYIHWCDVRLWDDWEFAGYNFVKHVRTGYIPPTRRKIYIVDSLLTAYNCQWSYLSETICRWKYE